MTIQTLSVGVQHAMYMRKQEAFQGHTLYTLKFQRKKEQVMLVLQDITNYCSMDYSKLSENSRFRHFVSQE